MKMDKCPQGKNICREERENKEKLLEKFHKRTWGCIDKYVK